MQHHLRSGRIITGEEWQTWREAGENTLNIAAMLGVTPSMARIIGRKFRAAGYIDPQYCKHKPGAIREFEIITDTGGYVLGVLWGTMGEWEEGYWVRHRDRWYVETVKEQLKIDTGIQHVASRTQDQYRLKIVAARDVRTISNLLQARDWAPRNAQERPYPAGVINDRGFIRAWVELHSSTEIRFVWNKKKTMQYPQKRLRIYGNWALMEEVNSILSTATRLQPRTLQKTSNKITKALIFQGAPVDLVVSWLYDRAEIWNPTARAKLEFTEV